MEGDKQKYSKAYFREFLNSNQCELQFFINTHVPIIGNFEKEIKAVRQKTDNVCSLRQHIQNKLCKILKDKVNLTNSENGEELKEIRVSLKRGNKNVKDGMVLKNFSSILKDGNVIFQVFDQKYTVSLNAPLVTHLHLPPILYATFSVQPKFYAIFTDKEMSSFIWYKSTDKINWKSAGEGINYSIKHEDVGHYLKLICIPASGENVKGPTAEVISQHKVERMPRLPTCPFENRHEFTKMKLEGLEFRVVSYNILADRYTSNDAFPYCPLKLLAIDYRKQLISKELLGYKANIICLQEVDDRHYRLYFRNKFKALGYGCLYHRKGNKIPEGLACIYDKSQFTLVESKHIVLSAEIERQKMFKYLWNQIQKNHEVKADFLKQPTSLQITVVNTKLSNKHLIIGNIHLYYHPDADHIRLIQINMATTYLNMMKEKYMKDEDVSVIFCGDFNSCPEKSLFPYMVQGRIGPKHEDCLKIGKNVLLHHKFKFESSCGTPKYTNYTADYKGCLDYIFIEANKIQVQQVVPLTEEEELSKHEGLPNDVFPSDHLALVVDLKIKNT